MSNLNSCSAECWGTKLSHLMLFRLNQTLNLHSGPLQKATYSTQMSHLEVPSIVLGTLLFAGASLKLAGTSFVAHSSPAPRQYFKASTVQRFSKTCLGMWPKHVSTATKDRRARSVSCVWGICTKLSLQWWLTRQINSIIKLQHST